MDKDYRVIKDEMDYKMLLNCGEDKFLPRDITEFPAYVVYDDFMEKWYKVDFKYFIAYLEAMRDEMREMMEDINWYLDKECDDGW